MSSATTNKASKNSRNFSKLRDYQKTVVRDMTHNRTRGVFLAPGLGKTLATLEAFDQLRRNGAVGSCLIVAPLRPMYFVWPQEIQKWGYKFSVGILHGAKKAKVWQEEHDVFLINYEGLKWLQPLIEADPDLCPDMLVLDESTKIKNYRSQRFQVLRQLLPVFHYRYILTGSPAPNGFHDLWSQIFMLDEGDTLGRYITQYRRRWFYQTGYGGYTWAPRREAPEEIQQALKPLVTHVGKDALKLPPLTTVEVPVELPAKAMKEYREFETTLSIEAEDTRFTAANAAVLTNKLRQIANGGLYANENSNQFLQIHDAKTGALRDLIEELSGEPALVLYEFGHDAARILDDMKKTYRIGLLSGGMTAKKQNEVLAQWNAGELDFLLAQTSAVAHGLNLQAAGRHVVYYALTWNLEDFEQAYQRIYRQGQDKPVVIHYLVAQGTIDHVLIRALAAKDRRQQALLEGLRSYMSAK